MSKNRRPVVSVIIPCYGQAHFLHQAIESVLAQSYPQIEPIVVDDGSPDNTSEVAGRYPVVRVVRQDNRGLAEARNAGFRASTGDYVLFLDADDRLTPNAVESHLSCFAKNTNAGFVVGDIDHIALDSSYLGSLRWPILKENHYEELLKVNHVANNIAIMFRRSVIERVGGFIALYHPAEDYELLLRVARLFPSAHHRNVVACYRRYPASLSRRGATMLRAMNQVMHLQRDTIKGDRRLLEACRQGELYWRDYYGVVTVKEIGTCLARGDLGQALRASGALLRYVRGRLLVWPWTERQRLVNVVRRRFRHLRERAEPHPKRA
jgi:glycosyltransferase involved in cell wall biosynthesis